MKKTTITLLLGMFLLFNNQVFAESHFDSNTQKAYINLEWWEKFNDPILEKYINKALAENHELKKASIIVKEGEQTVRQSLGQEMPVLDFAGNINKTFSSSQIEHGESIIPDYSQHQIMLPLTMSYEIDIWGKNRLKTKSAKQKLEIIKQQERSAYISLTSLLATSYFNLVKLDKMIEYQNEIVDIQQTILNMIKEKHKAGMTSVVEVNNEKKNLSIAQRNRDTLEKDRELLLNELKTILVIPEDENIERASFDKISLIKIPDQINSDIIENRPDFMISKTQLKKIGIDVKIAKKELLPSFTISGNIGFNSYKLSDMFGSDTFLSSVNVTPFWNIFSGGKKRALLRYKKYQYDEECQNYEETILNAVQEINNSLVISKTAKNNYESSLKILDLENNNYELISEKYNIGGTSKLEQLKSYKELLASEKNEISNKINCVISTISLYKAVGGQDLSSIEEKYTL